MNGIAKKGKKKLELKQPAVRAVRQAAARKLRDTNVTWS
jgi:hypothetical protein